MRDLRRRDLRYRDEGVKVLRVPLGDLLGRGRRGVASDLRRVHRGGVPGNPRRVELRELRVGALHPRRGVGRLPQVRRGHQPALRGLKRVYELPRRHLLHPWRHRVHSLRSWDLPD